MFVRLRTFTLYFGVFLSFIIKYTFKARMNERPIKPEFLSINQLFSK